MELKVTTERTAAGTRFNLSISHCKAHTDVDAFFEFPTLQVALPRCLDGFVFGILLFAMKQGEDLVVRGTMTGEGLRKAHEWQEAWACWHPKKYQAVRILPDEVAEGWFPKPENGAVSAFSGGVDATFTVLRHGAKILGNAAYPLDTAVVMVHGFDVRLSATDQYQALVARTKPFLDQYGLSLIEVRTNLKELKIQDWENSHMTQIAAVLHCLSDRYRYGLVGSSEAYSALVLPWGSNPATDHLLSSSLMQLVHDGAGHSRSDKVREIAGHPLASKVLKVCWEGADGSRNCGVCEKCVRTKLNFLAVAGAVPACFDEDLDLRLIKGLKIRTGPQLAELVSVLKVAKDTGVAAPWVKILDKRLRRGYSRPSLVERLLRKVVTVWKPLRAKVTPLWGLLRYGAWYLFIPGRRALVVGTPVHRNLGDHAIALAELQFLETHIPGIKIREIPTGDSAIHGLCLRWLVRRKDLLCFIGGGNFGNAYLSEERLRRETIRTHRANRCIVFPQTMFYTDDAAGTAEREKTAEIFAGHPDLHLFARESVSFELMKAAFPHNKIHLCPDIVLSWDLPPKQLERKGVLLCLRNDKEGTLKPADWERVEAAAQKCFSEVRRTDTKQEPEWNRTVPRMELVSGKLDELRRSELVVTDRLHGMIFAAITGTPCLVFSNYNHKIRSSFEWLKDLGSIALVDGNTNLEEWMLKYRSLASQPLRTPERSGPFAELAALLQADESVTS